MTDEEYRTSGTVVGPPDAVRFQDGTQVAYTPPDSTCDPRSAACRDHHVACDCREAEFAEDRQEFRAITRNVHECSNRVLRGHYTWAYTIDGEIDYEWQCTCTGCQLARSAEAMRKSWDQDDEGTTLYPSLYADPGYINTRKAEETRRIIAHRQAREAAWGECPF